MIIGQGQLDSILNSRSENRRAVIEEAAGVLKHRRRKERAERRLAATQENLERLGDLVREVRRQMRPLERQAASARSYADVEAELRAARHALFATRLHGFEARRRRARARAGRVVDARARTAPRTRHARRPGRRRAAAEMASRREEMLASTLGTLQGLAERARGHVSIIEERERSLRQALVASADENVIATLEADAARLATDLASARRARRPRSARPARAGSRRARGELAAAASELRGRRGARRPSEGDEAALAAARERVALLERSLASLRESERRATARLADARERAAPRRVARARRRATVARAASLERDERRVERDGRRRASRRAEMRAASRPTRRCARRPTSPRAPRRAPRRSRARSTSSRAPAAAPSSATSRACSARSST